MSKQQMLADLQSLREQLSRIQAGNADVRGRLAALSLDAHAAAPPDTNLAASLSTLTELTAELSSLDSELEVLRGQTTSEASVNTDTSTQNPSGAEVDPQVVTDLKTRITTDIIQAIQQQHKASVATSEEATKLKKYILAEVKARSALDEELSSSILDITRQANAKKA